MIIKPKIGDKYKWKDYAKLRGYEVEPHPADWKNISVSRVL
tara:strand:- start:4128 stop:4250 length:123 start_codon:yes stop_codon:yes gene_type:complete